MIYIHPIDEYACGHYRLLWPLQALVEKYPDLKERFKVNMPGTDGGISARVRDGRVFDVVVPDDCEAVVLQRPSSIYLGQSIAHLRRRGVRVVVELDDDLEALTPRHPSWRLLRVPGHAPEVLRMACKHADAVTATTPALLAKYAVNGNGVLLPNYMPRHLLPTEPKPEHDELVLGWPGAISTHPDDLGALGNALTRLPSKQFTVVGGGDEEIGRRKLGITPTFTGNVPFHDWLPAIRNTLDVGVAPLELTPFNNGKSWLKPLELAAAGVPFACSPAPDYRRLDAGLIVRDNKPREWAKVLRWLLESSDLRENEVGRNTEIVMQNLLEDHVDEWAQVWVPEG